MHGRARSQALAYLKAVQSAFYAENRDVTDAQVLAKLADPFGMSADAFLEDFASPAAVKTASPSGTVAADARIRDVMRVLDMSTPPLGSLPPFSCFLRADNADNARPLSQSKRARSQFPVKDQLERPRRLFDGPALKLGTLGCSFRAVETFDLV